MDVIQTMCGKWSMDPSGSENVEAFCKAMDMPADVTEMMMKMTDVVTELTVSGDTIKVVTTTAAETETLEFKLGDNFKSNSHGIESDNKFTVEGNVMVGEHVAFGKKTTSRRYLQDEKIIIDSDFNGTKMKYVFVRS